MAAWLTGNSVVHIKSYHTSGPVSTGMVDRIQVQFLVRDIYLSV